MSIKKDYDNDRLLQCASVYYNLVDCWGKSIEWDWDGLVTIR